MGLQEYREKMEAQLKELTAKLEELKDQAAKATADVGAEMTKQMEALKPKLETAQQKLKELQAASGPAWDRLKEGSEKAMADLKQTWESIKAKFH
jgi:predicted  nucleic acid-binding Zn-ribbon protein